MDHNLLVSELQSLVLETRRRNPEVKDASERALELLRGGQLPRDDLVGRSTMLRTIAAPDFAAHSQELLAPVTLGCKTKVAKTVGISIAALQRLVALGGVPTTLTTVANQAVDIQLKILQTLLSILTFNRDVHDEVLGQALLLCFKLQDSRVSVVSSTAAATLRQAVMLVFDRLSAPSEPPPIPLTLPTDPPTELTLTPSAMDAFSIFSDLCLLTAAGPGSAGIGASLWGAGEKEKPRMLKLSSLQRTFGLELVESILSGYEEGVKKRPELLFLLRQSLAPLLLKLQAERPSFPIALRVCRLIFLLIRSFTEQIPGEVEVFLSLLIRTGTGDRETEEAKKEVTPPWLRVLALEILRGICGDSALLQKLYRQYDGPDGPGLFRKLVSALGKLMNEKPSLLGIGTQMNGIGVPNSEGMSKEGSYLDMSLGIMAHAASAGMSTVGSMIGQGGGGLGSHSALKLRLIEQHDKAEAPPVPETYVYLLALQSLDTIAEGILHAVQQAAALPLAVKAMAESAWPALLAALSFSIGANLSDTIFAEVLSALQDFTIACGVLELTTPRDAFLSTLGKYAVPPAVVAAMQAYLEAPNAGRSNSVIGAEALGLTALGVGAPTGPPSLSERNLACLKSTVTTARILAGSLGEAWHDVLEILQNANFLLAGRKPGMTRRPTVASPIATPSPRPRASIDSVDARPETFNELDPESIQTAINVLFDSMKDLDAAAFETFVSALCTLSSEMIGVDPEQTATVTTPGSGHLTAPSSPKSPAMMLSPGEFGSRRRTSGLNISHSIKSGERSFSLTKLRVVAMLNLPRLVSCDPAGGWTVITQHLLSVSRHVSALSTIRIQASDTLSELLLAALRIGKDPRIQHQVFDVLVRQVDPNPISYTVSTDYDVRSQGYQTLRQILESSGHALEVGWGTIFNMLNAVCKEPAPTKRNNSSSAGGPGTLSHRPSMLFSKGDAALVRIAFPSLNLICTDFLSSLDNQAMRQCIVSLVFFGRQGEDVNITLAAIGLLWNVSDAVQGGDKELWLYLLTELLELGRDARLEVRSSAMQTLFRCVELYGSGLSAGLWEDVLWKVVFPILDSAAGDESQVLALTSIGTIFNTFLPQISKLPSFGRILDSLLDRLKQSFVADPRQCCTAALKAFERVLLAVDVLSAASPATAALILDRAWRTFIDMGAALPSAEPYTQENLVALVRIATALHAQVFWTPERIRQLSNILRSTMMYSKSPEYRPDVDVMSALQTAIVELVGSSLHLGPNIVLSDLAEFSRLAYMGDGGSGRSTYVAVSKWCMPRIGEVFGKVGGQEGLYADGTVESVIAAYSLPIKLKYDCPAASKYGEDLPLWRTAMTNFAPVLERVMTTMASTSIPFERYEAIWTQIMDVLAGVLLADAGATPPDTLAEDEELVLPLVERMRDSMLPRLGDARMPERIVESFGETLRKASRLYHYDSRSSGGTTAPVVEEGMERLRYWAFGVMISSSTRGQKPGRAEGQGAGPSKVIGDGDDVPAEEEERRIARGVVGALMRRCESAIRGILADAALRGQMPFGRVREEELLYILRHLATMRVWPGSLTPTKTTTPTLAAAYTSSSRAHLFRLYPLLLELSFSRGPLPSMWMFPSEHARVFRRSESLNGNAGARGVNGASSVDGRPNGNSGAEEGKSNGDGEAVRNEVGGNAGREGVMDGEVDAGDGGDLIEVNARDLARRCLELVGEEIGLA